MRIATWNVNSIRQRMTIRHQPGSIEVGQSGRNIKLGLRRIWLQWIIDKYGRLPLYG
jgi:exonuclease III